MASVESVLMRRKRRRWRPLSAVAAAAAGCPASPMVAIIEDSASDRLRLLEGAASMMMCSGALVSSLRFTRNTCGLAWTTLKAPKASALSSAAMT